MVLASVAVNESDESEYHVTGCLGVVEEKCHADIILIAACCISFVVLELLGISVISSNN